MRHHVNGVMYTRLSTHTGNSLVTFYPGGDTSLPACQVQSSIYSNITARYPLCFSTSALHEMISLIPFAITHTFLLGFTMLAFPWSGKKSILLGLCLIIYGGHIRRPLWLF